VLNPTSNIFYFVFIYGDAIYAGYYIFETVGESFYIKCSILWFFSIEVSYFVLILQKIWSKMLLRN